MYDLSQGVLWILCDRKPVMVTDMMQWAKWMETHWQSRRVGLTTLSLPGHDEMRVSTVFLGIASGIDRGTPQLFESMVQGGPLHGRLWRYCTWEEAEAGHETFVEHATMAGEIATEMLREKLTELSKGAQ